MLFKIDLKKAPAQSVYTELAGQNCTIQTREIGGRQYFSLSVDGRTIVNNSLMADRVRLLRAVHTGFKGDFMAVDLQKKSDPIWEEWGSRFLLIYSDEASYGRFQ